jgi:hypothetical protein
LDPSTVSDFGEDVDMTLRNVSQQFPTTFARAILPPGMNVSAATWLDTQMTARQRRLDRVLDIVADGRRRLEHTEWQLEWEKDLPERLFEYHFLIALAVVAETPERHLRPPIRTTVVLLSGREKPWPAQDEYRTSPDGEPFTGVVFHIDAVYQRTVAELAGRESPFWLMFAPLAVDADAATMSLAVAALRQRTTPHELEGLATAMLVMAETDKRHRGLRDAILPLLTKETFMQSWVYKQGKVEGKAEGEANALLLVLRSRGFSVPDDLRERILACTDIPQIEAWLGRALVATRVEDVLNGHG